ncbi:hypothetical protein [Novipirellula caenicola]|uniref:HNH endonuclease n=1 Tax=Novipirellula caenicola TaxID=1536901 RepID=A0ABP9VXE9_9BACT
MTTLAIPDDDAIDVFRTCISKVRDKDLKNRLSEIEYLIAKTAAEYRKKAEATKLFRLKPMHCAGDVKKDELTSVYTSRFALKGSPGRHIYDRLKNAPAHGRCPLCWQRTVGTLDHYLPKAEFPIYSVLPINLIPACIDCNKLKSDEVPRKASEQTIHPYFDNFEDDRWLVASHKEDDPYTVRFSTDPPDKWTSIAKKRLQKHFQTFELGVLYSSHAAVEIEGIIPRLKNIKRIAGTCGVKTHLHEEWESRLNARTNSWQTALYCELSSNKWFYSGGFE